MRINTTPSTMITVASTVVLAWTLAACATVGAGTEGTSSSELEPTVEPATQHTAAADSATDSVDDAEQASFAGGTADIPLPEHHEVVQEQMAEGFDTMLVHSPGDYQGHADFYREELPAAGWQVVSEEPAPSTFGTVFEVMSDTSRAWVHLETFDGGTAVSVSVGELDAAAPVYVDQAGGHGAVDVALPDGFPDDVPLPVYSTSTMVAGGAHGGDMWVLEYVAAGADIRTVEAVIEQEVHDKDWTTTDVKPEGEGTTYVLERAGWELMLVLLQERNNPADTSLHYTLRSAGT